jgi:hypothetical protein
MGTGTRSVIGAEAVALLLGIVVLLVAGDWRSTPSWSEHPFPVEGWFVSLMDLQPCAARVEHDHPDWTVEGCGTTHSFVDGISRRETADHPEVHVQDHGDDGLAPNPWFAPMFDEWQGEPSSAGDLTLYPRVLVYGGADIIGVDADGVPVLYVQRNEHDLESVSVFVRDDATRTFPSTSEVAAALDLSGLPDDVLARSLVATDRVDAIRRQFDS